MSLTPGIDVKRKKRRCAHQQWLPDSAASRKRRAVSARSSSRAECLLPSHFLGALLIAGLIGGVTASWTAFLIALVGLLVAGVVAGDIRR